MALTAKPISTISYNSENFLKRKLEQLLSAQIIVDYRWIKHNGEDGDKDHIHLWIQPNRRLDTGVLAEEFKEITTDNEKPLGVLPIRTSATDHWIMYVLHDPLYLANHKSDNDGDGKIIYQLTDIETPYPEQLQRDYRKALSLQKTDNQVVIDALMKGQSVTQLLYEHQISPMSVLAIRNALAQDEMERQIKQAQQEKITQTIVGVDRKEVTEYLPQLKIEKRQGLQTKSVKVYQIDENGEAELIEERLITEDKSGNDR